MKKKGLAAFLAAILMFVLCLPVSGAPGGTVSVPGETLYAPAGAALPSLAVQNLNGDETQFGIYLTDETPEAGAVYSAAVWSGKNGQDDIRWIDMADSGNGTFAITVNPGEFKHAGVFHVHVYKRTRTNQMIFRCAEDFTVSAPSFDAVKVQPSASGDGTYGITVSGLSSPSGIRSVLVPVWCAADQSDIVWYPAQKQADGSYIVTLDPKNHGFHTGSYKIHVYGVMGNGLMEYAGSSSCNVEKMPVSISAEKQGGTAVQLSAKNAVSPAGITSVKFAVWSEVNGQDDLRWYTVPYNAGIAGAVCTMNTSDHSGTGRYFVHVYADTRTSVNHFLGNTEFSITAETEIILGQGSAQTLYPLTIRNPVSASGISRVSAAVWSRTKDQDDIVWYNMAPAGNNTYQTTIDVRNHKHDGEYYIHVYAFDKAGKPVFQGKCDGLSVTASAAGTVSASSFIPNQGTFTASVRISGSTPGVREIKIPVWCAADQSDIVWYTASSNGSGTWTASVSKANHKNHTGTYHIHAYAVMENGLMTFVGGTSGVLEQGIDILSLPVGSAVNPGSAYADYFRIYEIPDSVFASMAGNSFTVGGLVARSSLRYLRVLYVDFSGVARVGEIVVNVRAANDTLAVFRELYEAGYQIRRMELIDKYYDVPVRYGTYPDRATTADEASVEADNSSAFNYRASTNDPSQLSRHALGLAIDINPLENPFVYANGVVDGPDESYAYVNRANASPANHMLKNGDIAVTIFKNHGFTWGGDWAGTKDYQHFDYMR